MTKTNKKLMSLVVAVMYALCILVAAPVTAYADTSSHQTSAYTATQKWRATYYAQKSLAGLPSSKYASWSYHTGDSAKLQLLVTVTEKRLATAKRMGLKITTFKNYYRLAIAKARVVVLLANEARVAAAALAAKAAKLVVDTASAKVVTDSIVALPTTITLANAAAVTAARTAYTALNVEAKALVLPATLATLVAAELKVVGLNGVFAVTSVTAPNGRNVVVNFNKAINEDTLVAANVKVYIGAATTVTTWTSNVSADGKTVTLGLTATIPQDTDVKVVIADVATAAVATDKVSYTTTVRMKDITAPAVTSVTATTSKTFTIASTEALNLESGFAAYHVLSNITIDGLKLVAMLTPDYAKNTVTVTLGSSLVVGNHTIVVDGYTDMAGFVAPKFTGTITVVADVTAPVMVSAKATTRDAVTVTFDEPIATLGTITILGQNYTTGTQSADKKSFDITLSTNFLGYASLIKETITYIGTVDMEGNTIATAKTLDFIATDDTTIPTATVAISTANIITITYSKVMSDSGLVTIKNSTGVATKTALVPVLGLTKKTATISAAAAGFSAATVAANYTVVLTAAKDASIRQNSIASTTATVAVTDLTNPTVTKVVTKTAYAAGPPVVNGQATVYFSEAMDTASVTNLANYFVDFTGTGTTLVLLSTITDASATVSADGKSVLLTIPGASYMAGVSKVRVLAVKDSIGNLLDTADFNVGKLIATTGGVLTVAGKTVDAVNTVKLTFTNPMATIVPSDIKVYKNDGTTLAFVGVSYVLDTAKTTATVTLNGNLTAAAWVAGDTGIAKVELVAGESKDIYGQPASLATTVVIDQVAPTLVTLAAGTLPNSVKFTFSEPVKEAAPNDFVNALLIKDADGVVLGVGTAATTTVAGLTTKDVTVTFKGALLTAITASGTAGDGTKTIKVSLPIATGVKDIANNAIAPVADTTLATFVADTTGPTTPVITTLAQTLNAATIVITGTTEAGSTVAITGGSAAVNATVTGTAYTATVSLTQDAVNTLVVKATDAAGNDSATATVAITEDSTAPAVTTVLGTGTPVTIVSAATATITFGETLTAGSKTAVETALSAASANDGTYGWAGAVLTITGGVGNTVYTGADVSAVLTDLTGNASAALVIVDAN